MTLNSLNILLVDDHPMFRDGVRTALTSQIHKYVFNICECKSGEDAIKKVVEKDYDLIILDYILPMKNGAQTALEIRTLKPEIKILILSFSHDYYCVKSSVEAGVKGYMLKSEEPANLFTAIDLILAGKNYFSEEIYAKLFNYFIYKEKEQEQTTVNRRSEAKDVYLTEREKQIIKLLMKEKSNKEIALKFNISERTVEKHRHNMMTRLNTKNIYSLIKYANELNLI